jgi:hypothetical protein
VVSGRPWTTLNAGSPGRLDEVVEDADGRRAPSAHRPSPRRRASFEPNVCWSPAGRDDSHERLNVVGVGVEAVELRLGLARVVRTWQAARMPRVIRMRWGRKSMPVRPSSYSISPMWQWVKIPYAFTLSLTSPNWSPPWRRGPPETRLRVDRDVVDQPCTRERAGRGSRSSRSNPTSRRSRRAARSQRAPRDAAPAARRRAREELGCRWSKRWVG